MCVLGPSGSGKSTLLRAVAGLAPEATGQVRWDGADLAGVPPHRRGFGLMFQDHALFPHRDVIGNVRFGLRMQRRPRAEADERARATLALVGLAGFEHRRVRELSGGEQQRVALARGTRARAAAPDARRAARRARPRAPRPARRRAARALRAPRPDDRVRDPRPRRGVRARRPGGRDARRAASTRPGARRRSGTTRPTRSSPGSSGGT